MPIKVEHITNTNKPYAKHKIERKIKRKANKYNIFIGKRLKEGKTMAESIKLYRGLK